MTLWLLGYPDQALHESHEALTLAQELAHPFSLAYALVFAAFLHQFRREVQADAGAGRGRDRALDRAGLSTLGGDGTILQGWALAMQGQASGGDGPDAPGAWPPGGPLGPSWLGRIFLTLLAEAYAQLGQAEETAERCWPRRWRPSAARRNAAGKRSCIASRASLLLRHPEHRQAEAEACFQQALDVARRQEAKSLELRAAMSLSRLWQQQGKRAEAHALLAPIYGWFTEGFDTADLQEAKALLEELA